MIGLDNHNGPRPCLSDAAARRLVRLYLDGRAKRAANPRRVGRPRYDGSPASMRELADHFGVSQRTAWRYVAAWRERNGL